ncbi:MAG: hypothetical protein E7E55_10075, partial [Staphylococcus sp.]|nr:hypothetical protein [Staphylococcus sp.]
KSPGHKVSGLFLTHYCFLIGNFVSLSCYMRNIPYMLILSFGMCYVLEFNAGLGVSVAVGSLIGMTVDYEKKRKKQKQEIVDNS